MRIIKGLEINTYWNIRHAKLKDLKDFNIFIGPNNCGKTNLLKAINVLSEMGFGPGHGSYHCEKCQKAFNSNENIIGVGYHLKTKESYLNMGRAKIIFLFNEEDVEKLVPGVMEKQRKILDLTDADYKNELSLSSADNTFLTGEHISLFAHNDILDEIKRSVLFCPDGRLQNYKEKNFKNFIQDKNFTGAEFRRWIKFLSDLIDPTISDQRYEDLIKKVDGEDFVTTIEEQGSGVRSLVCLIADILSAKDAKIVLIDEPELGLNPLSKQEFLKYLLNESKSKQIFIATQDPTFVNPTLWENDRVAVFFYSPSKREFVKIKPNENKEDPATFAGYLPHTTSLKNIHIYVEGSSDVYIFQIFLRKYLKDNRENWTEILNKIGIYHLAGSFWEHLLYTIPKSPYKCIVVLDGDKREEAREICDKYNKITVNTSRFNFCEKVGDVKFISEADGKHPVYCLKEECIEEYLDPKPDCADPDYNKKVEGSKIAEEMDVIPEELKILFEIILKEVEQ
ncbi:MAG: recombination protein F [Candidatus Syntrophoarchaeum sp. GoM_oil]|nr:MAG: recombination protein F [Candidatus Syntrophoarchaeum sp. GoM_oil]